MADEDPSSDVVEEFLLRLAAALNATGATVDEAQRRVERIGHALGAGDVHVSSFPTFVMLTMGDGGPTTLRVTPAVSDVYRLDQIAAIERLCAATEHGEIGAAEALELLTGIETLPPRFGRLLQILGYIVLSAGLCLVLRPARQEVLAAAVLGLVVGLLRPLVEHRRPLQMLLPVLAAFVVAALSGVAKRADLIDTGIRPIVAALIIFLPGATLTAAVLELRSGQIVSGASRLVSGIMTLALLAFGILAGSEVAGLSASEALTASTPLLGAWAPWLGVATFAIGVALTNSAPYGSWPGLFLVLFAAWAAQVGGNALWGVYLGAFLGAVALVVTSSVVERLPDSVPRQASFLPGFWLLVPGALGLIGVTRWATADVAAPITDLRVTAGSIFAVAVGVLVGSQVWDWIDSGGNLVARWRRHA